MKDFAKKEGYPKRVMELIAKATEEIPKAMLVHRQKRPKESPTITSFFKKKT